MLKHLLAPVHGIDLDLLRRAGRFASPDGEGDGGEGGDKDGGGEKPKDEGGKPSDPSSRISALVEERNAARQEAEKHKAAIEKLRGELDQLKANDQSKVVSDLQKKLDEMQTGTATRFDKLLETELANLPDDAAALVQSVPGSSEAKFDFLVANRARLVKTDAKPEDRKPEGAKHEKTPQKGDSAGVSSVVKAAVEARKKAKVGFPGLTG